MKLLTFVLFFLATITVSCKLNPPETDTIYNVPDEFNLELASIRDSATGVADLGIRFTTTNLYPCKNVKVDAETNWQADNVLILLNKIVQPANCSAGEAPASVLLSLGNRPNAEYVCKINLGGAVSIEGKLKISDETVGITFDERAGIILKRPNLNLVPTGTIWGWVGFEKPADQLYAKQFLSELTDLTTSPDLKPGFFGDFEWTSQNDFNIFLEKPAALQTLNFVRSEFAPRAELEALLKKYRNDTGHPLTIFCWTTTGRI